MKPDPALKLINEKNCRLQEIFTCEHLVEQVACMLKQGIFYLKVVRDFNL